MNARQQAILDALEFGDYTANELALKLNAPAPSIRRAVAALRKQGHAISFSEQSSAYYLDSVEPAVPVVDAYDTDIDSSDEDAYDDGGW